jgi:purine-binding chemotaxis protein CheW
VNESPQHTAPDTGAAPTKVLSFFLDGREYAVDILCVQEIRTWEKPTRVPRARPHMLGVSNLRGALIPIIDLRKRFGIPTLAPSPLTVIVVIHVSLPRGNLTCGLVVDAVSKVHDLAPDELKPAPPGEGAIDAEFIRGLTLVAGRMLIVLDPAHLVAASLFPTEGNAPARVTVAA